MRTTLTENRPPPAPPRVVAISGMIFAGLYIAGLVFARLAVPANPREPGAWLADPTLRSWVRFALNVIPFTGIAFLWFMGVLRNRIGGHEDRFLATVFLGSGLLFVAMLFVAAAVSQALLDNNLLDGTPATYAKGPRLSYFWNAAMQNNLSRIFLLPSTLGGGFVVRNEAEPVFNFFLLDTNNTPTISGLPTLFSNGAVLYGEYILRTNWFDRPGHSAVGFLYSTAKRSIFDLNPYAQIQAIQLGASLETRTSAWTVTYRFDQVLYADVQDPKRNWTLHGDAGLTDGDPNPIRWFANLSLVGNSPIRSRANDTIGIGYYHLQASDLPVLKNLGFGAENGVELFYNVAVTPWFHLTPDLQIIDPANRNNPTAILIGIRGRLSF